MNNKKCLKIDFRGILKRIQKFKKYSYRMNDSYNTYCMYDMIDSYCMNSIDNMRRMCYTNHTYKEKESIYIFVLLKGFDNMNHELTIVQPKTIDNSRVNIEKELENFFKLEDYRGETPRTYTTGINCFLQWLKDNNIECVGKDTIISYKAYLKRTFKTRTTNTYLSGLRCLFRYLNDKGVVNIMNNVKNLKLKKGYAKLPIPLDKFLEIDETLKQERHDEQTYRDYALFSLAVRCMLREIEISRSDKTDIVNIENRYVLMIQGKGCDTKDDMAILEEDTLQPILDYLKVRGKDEYEPLFVSCATNHKGNRLTTRSISRIFKNILVRFGLDSELYTGHSTRHTGATYLKKCKTDIEDIQQVLRHKDINTTMIYAHLEDRLENPTEGRLQDFIRKEREKKYGSTQSYSNS